MMEHHNQSVTIDDVAQAAGVSVSTVSRILNGKPDVAKTTRKHVLKVIETLGYIPHISAQSLAAKRSRTIALLFPVEYTGLTQLELDFFIGAAAGAEAKNHLLNLVTTSVNESRLFNLYRSGQADGIILMQVQMDDWRAEALHAKNYPFVMIGRCADNIGLNYVDLDFEAAVILAFDHLRQLGHREIGFIARPSMMRERNLGPAIRLLNGYLQGCQQYGIPPAFREPSLEPQTVYEAAHDLLVENPHLTALISSTGAAAVPIHQAVRATGRSVPQDFSLVAVTTHKIATLITPPLTAINFPTDKMGYQAAQILTRLLHDPETPTEQVLLAPELVIRESTGLAK
jgi:DNA-binding LacI/PurR family transcriptional regulator